MIDNCWTERRAQINQEGQHIEYTGYIRNTFTRCTLTKKNRKRKTPNGLVDTKFLAQSRCKVCRKKTKYVCSSCRKLPLSWKIWPFLSRYTLWTKALSLTWIMNLMMQILTIWARTMLTMTMIPMQTGMLMMVLMSDIDNSEYYAVNGDTDADNSEDDAM